MLNDAKYKSCVTLILASSNSNAHNIQNSDIEGQNESSGMISYETDKSSSNETNQLSYKMNRTFVHSESFNESLESNDTIIPIKYDKSDFQEQQQFSTSTKTSPKYCCTLEVKFVWYDIGT